MPPALMETSAKRPIPIERGPTRRTLEDANVESALDRGSACSYAELRKGVAEVPLNGLLAQDENLGDLSVCPPLCHQAEYFPLTLGRHVRVATGAAPIKLGPDPAHDAAAW